ncbi:hypothetical protein KSP39_PZI010455 [Platanthera zijinensis]|uniref:Tyrosine-specific transport protein n=1 Tax=Platanthera zijinensis TaxID=2320716 RepID=A0AAP0G6U7_9ASPA
MVISSPPLNSPGILPPHLLHRRTLFPPCQSSPLLILHCPSKHYLTFIKNRLPNSSSSSNSSTCRALNDPIPSPLTSSFIEQPDAGEVFEDRSSFWGAVSLIIGTAVGPGMLGLPSATIRSGPFPSTISIILSWIYVISSIILVAELSFDAMEEDGVDEVSFTALASRSLGPTFGSFVSIVYACLSFSLLIACVSGIGSLLSQCFHAMNPIVANALFPSFVGIVIGIFPFRVIDFSNRLLCALMLVSISVLVATGLSIGVNNLLSSFAFVSWRPEAILPSIPVTVLTLGFHVITPYICKLLRHSVYQARKAILYGGFVPLTMVLSWNVAVLGLAGGGRSTFQDPIELLLSVNHIALPAVRGFAFAALATSLIGYALCFPKHLLDTVRLVSQRLKWKKVEGVISLSKKSDEAPVMATAGEVSFDGFDSEKYHNALMGDSSCSVLSDDTWNNIFVTWVVLIVPIFISSFFKTAFAKALNFAGIYANCFLFGVLPPVMAWISRSRKRYSVRLVARSALEFAESAVLRGLVADIDIPSLARWWFGERDWFDQVHAD